MFIHQQPGGQHESSSIVYGWMLFAKRRALQSFVAVFSILGSIVPAVLQVLLALGNARFQRLPRDREPVATTLMTGWMHMTVGPRCSTFSRCHLCYARAALHSRTLHYHRDAAGIGTREVRFGRRKQACTTPTSSLFVYLVMNRGFHGADLVAKATSVAVWSGSGV